MPTKIGKPSQVFACLYAETSAYHPDQRRLPTVCAFLLCQNHTQYGDGKCDLSVCLLITADFINSLWSIWFGFSCTCKPY